MSGPFLVRVPMVNTATGDIIGTKEVRAMGTGVPGLIVSVSATRKHEFCLCHETSGLVIGRCSNPEALLRMAEEVSGLDWTLPGGAYRGRYDMKEIVDAAATRLAIERLSPVWKRVVVEDLNPLRSNS